MNLIETTGSFIDSIERQLTVTSRTRTFAPSAEPRPEAGSS